MNSLNQLGNTPHTLPHQPLISVAILNWNGAELLKKFLPSVVAYTPSTFASIVVVDNGSSDGSLALVSKEFPQVATLALPENLGFAGGYNQAIKTIQTPFVCMLNSDVEVTEGWLDAPLELLKHNQKLAAVQPKILSYYQREHFEYAGAAGGYIDALGYPFCRGRILDKTERDEGQYETEQPIAWASGAALFIRREAFLKVGGFDKDFFCHMEEIDLAWRLVREGYQLRYTPQSVVYHVGGASLSVAESKKTYLNHRNNLLMLAKNLPQKAKKSILRKRFALDCVAALRWLLLAKPAHARAVAKAWRDFLKMKKNYPYDPTQEAKKDLAYSQQVMPFSIVWHYILGQRRYSQLPKINS